MESTLVERYLHIENIEDFHTKWSIEIKDNDIHIREKYQAIRKLFYNPPGDKSQNIWANEIREIGLFNLFFFTPEEAEAFSLSDLHNEWIGIIIHSIDVHLDKKRKPNMDYNIHP